MAVPKKKTSHQKQMQRRAHWKAGEQTLGILAVTAAPQTDSPHRLPDLPLLPR